MQRSGVLPSARPSVCLSNFLTLIGRASHTQRDSPGGITRRGQRTFLRGRTCVFLLLFKHSHSREARKETAKQTVYVFFTSVVINIWQINFTARRFSSVR